MKDGDLAVGILVDADLGPDEVGSGWIGRDLQAPAPPGNSIVGSDGALLLDAQDIAPLAVGNRDEGRSGLGRGEASSMVTARSSGGRPLS
jgi:hypothetical protein